MEKNIKKAFAIALHLKVSLLFLVLSCSLTENVFAVAKTSAGNGAWSTAALWSPSGVPVAGDVVTIRTGDSLNINTNYSIGSLIVNSGGVVYLANSKVLTLTGSLTVNGRMTMNQGDIIMSTVGSAFAIGAGGSFTWEPKTNTLAYATLFTNGVESFATTSTLIIKKWYSFTTALGTVVTGNFGNLTLNSLNGSFITEWSQSNQFQTHLVVGTLTIDQGWIVLDKTSAISTTTIGNISLLNANSYLDLHGGTHSGSFTVNTTNITIVGGMMTGIYDGNGNVTLNVSGDVSISSTGYFYLIYNDGVASVGNGNATMNVTGTFSQSSGDFRGIYNLTTYAAGISTLSFNTLTLTGGIFMGHYGCHAANGTNTLTVTGNLTVTYALSTDKFRAVGLSSLASTINNVKLNFNVSGNITTSGHASAEFFSQVASGVETVTVGGNASFGGCTNSFDYGVAAAAHAFSLAISGNLTVTGGTVNLAKIGGNGTSTVTGNVTVSGGTLIAKADVGTQTFTVNGNYSQSAGTFFLHSNSTTNTTNLINTIINGSFTHSGGTINFDDNTSSSAITHTLTINSSSYNLTGAGTITHASSGTGTVFGMINFSRPGTVTYTRSSSSHQIQQVKQKVISGCTLDISSGNLQVASHATAATDYLKVASGGILQMNTSQVVSNATSTNSGMVVESGGLMKIKKTTGLYDGTTSGTISSSGNMNFYLDANSTIEYAGVDNQVLTGTGVGLATTTNHKYGNLKINFAGTSDVEYVYPTSSNVYVRTNLNLEAGELKLNNFTVTIESGAAGAVSRNTGYAKSETNAAVNNSILKWMSMASGAHIFPFGYSSTEYIPITFSPTAGTGGYVSISTRGTGTDNTPWPGVSNVAAVTNVAKDHIDVSRENVIDRWYNFDAPGFTANVVVSYRGIENTTLSANATGSFSIQSWNGTEWSGPMGSSIGVTSGIGTISLSGVTTFTTWVPVYTNGALPIELISFTAKLNGSIVDVNWSTASEKNNNFFTVERSADAKNFTQLEIVDGAGNSTHILNYSTKDMNPLTGTSYYRLKQTDFDGKFEYSKLAVVKNGVSTTSSDQPVQSTLKVYPNPFKDQFSADFQVREEEEITVQLVNAGGQVVMTQKVMATAGDNRFDYSDGYKLPSGSYVFIVVTSGGRLSKKIMKNM